MDPRVIIIGIAIAGIVYGGEKVVKGVEHGVTTVIHVFHHPKK